MGCPGWVCGGPRPQGQIGSQDPSVLPVTRAHCGFPRKWCCDVLSSLPSLASLWQRLPHLLPLPPLPSPRGRLTLSAQHRRAVRLAAWSFLLRQVLSRGSQHRATPSSLPKATQRMMSGPRTPCQPSTGEPGNSHRPPAPAWPASGWRAALPTAWGLPDRGEPASRS